MNNHTNEAIGATITATGALISWLPTVNVIIQILAGSIAIVVGIRTWFNLNKKQNNHHPKHKH